MIGIGANAAVFTLANALLFQDAPGISNPDDLVAVRWIVPEPLDFLARLGARTQRTQRRTSLEAGRDAPNG